MDGSDLQKHDDVETFSIVWDAATVLQADLVGFSGLAANLSKQGPQGAEILSSVLETFFDTLIRTVEARGGLIAGFAGDAVMAVWPGAGMDVTAHDTARIIHSELPDQIRCRISVASGRAGIDRYTHVGTDEIWLATGPAAATAARLNSSAAPGATISSRSRRPSVGEQDQTRVAPRHDRTPLTRVWTRITGEDGTSTFRDLTVLSCDLTAGAHAEEYRADQVAERLGRIFRHIEPWAGVPVNMMAEEKGTVLHIVFGLPPLGPSGRELRAMRAAVSIMADPKLGCPVGVADGRMFLSRHGTRTTRTMSAIGWPSSLATRLMQAATDAPLVDAATAERAGVAIDTQPLPALSVKGWADPVAIARIRDMSPANDLSLTSPLIHWLKDPRLPHPVHVLSGPRGIGRSEHMRGLCAIAQATDWRVIRPALRPDGAQLAYDGIARVAAELVSSFHDPPQFTASQITALRQFVPLRDLIAPPTLAQAPVPSGEQQQSLLESALSQLILHDLANLPPLLIALDDAQCLDRSSAAMLERVARDGVRVVIAVRTDEAAPPSEGGFAIEPLDLDGVERAICRLMNAPACEPDTVRELFRRSGGNPLFLRELVRDLSESGRLRMTGGALRLPTAEPADPELRSMSPATLRELAATRLDTCEPVERQVLSIASLLGQPFSAPDIAALPDAPPLAPIEDALASLLQREFLREAEPGQFAFRDDLVREVSYSALPFAARRRLHRHLAERCGQDDLADAARHWAGADQAEKAFACHERLARNASALFAHDEAIAHASHARLIAQRNGITLPMRRRIELLMTEGSAALEAVELRMAEARLSEALTAMGHPQSRSTVIKTLQLFPALARQVLHRVRGRATPASIPYAAMAASAHKDLAEIAYFEGELGDVLLHTLKSLNIAERVGLTREMVAGYTALSIGFETSRLPKLADTYAGYAKRTALAGGDPHDRAFTSLVALVLYSGRGDWLRADPAARDAIRLYGELGARGRWRQSVATDIHSRLTRGKLRSDDPALGELESGLDSRVSAQIRVWVKTARIGAALSGGEPVPIEAHKALAGLVGHPQLNKADETFALCTLALADVLMGETTLARQRAHLALDIAEKSPPGAWHLCNALRWLCCATTLLDDAPAAARARKVLRRFALKMPVAKPAAIFYSAFDQTNVSKRTEMLADAARLARQMHLVSDVEVFTNLTEAVGRPIPVWLQDP